MPGTGLSRRMLSQVTVSGSGGIWGQILCSCLSNYVITGLWWVLRGLLFPGQCSCSLPSFWFPSCPCLSLPMALWVNGCLPSQALESLLILFCPWVSATSRFLTAHLGTLPLWFVASSKQLTWIQYFNSILSLPTKNSANYHPGGNPYSFQCPDPLLPVEELSIILRSSNRRNL